MMRLWKSWCLGMLLIGSSAADAQTAQYAFRVNFTDKTGAAPATLSQRAMDRRTTQGIAIDSTDKPVSTTYINDILSLTSGKLHTTSRWLNNAVILLTDSTQILNLAGKTYIKDIKYVAYFASGLHKTTPVTETGASPVSSNQKTTGSANYYGAAYDQTHLVNGEYMHDRGYKGKGKLIAIMDEGFSGVDTGPGFDSMRQSGRMIDKHNFVVANDDVFAAYDHGTRCLSTMAANMPGVFVGSAPDAEYAIYVTEYHLGDYPIEMDNMVAAIERADSIGADIVVSSLGYNYFTNPAAFPNLTYSDIDGKSTIAAKGANMATQKGMLFVITAGNEGGGPWNFELTPGDADSALTVGSVNNRKEPASNSSYGYNFPAKIKPNVCMQGSPAAMMVGGPTATTSNGTSFATPQLAGWAACLWQANNNATPYKLRTAIEHSAHMYNTPGIQLGYGVPDFYFASEYLNIKNTESNTTSKWVEVVPNPAEQQLQIRINMPFAEKVSLSVTDAAGKLVYSTEKQLQPGMQYLKLDMPAMSRGVYFLNARTAADKVSIRFLQQ